MGALPRLAIVPAALALGFGLGLSLGLGLLGCGQPQLVNEPPPQPSTERLRPEDCDVGAELYRQRLELPPRAGSVVSNRSLAPPPPEEQARRLAEFVMLCRRDLVGRVRRLIVRCWSDAPDAETLQSCNQRF
ncbi:MAG: hypothetical protein U1A78_13235 [Polyangia bacterium]